VKDAAPTEVGGYRMEGGQEAILEILVKNTGIGRGSLVYTGRVREI
jgi:hypothetical protein